MPSKEHDLPTLILSYVCGHLVPLLLVVSVIFFWSGHNQPGGGFIGGLLAAEAVLMIVIAQGVDAARRRMPLQPGTLVAVGFLTAAAAGLPGLILGEPFFSGQWIELSLPLLGAKIPLGTPLLFDAGVYLLVIGATLSIAFTFGEK
jgi:multicomponent Na+:H+ antiporter subunit B